MSNAGPEKFTTTNMFVVTDEGVLVADGQGSSAETKGLVDAIRKVTSKPVTTDVIASDHGDHTDPLPRPLAYQRRPRRLAAPAEDPVP